MRHVKYICFEIFLTWLEILVLIGWLVWYFRLSCEKLDVLCCTDVMLLSLTESRTPAFDRRKNIYGTLYLNHKG